LLVLELNNFSHFFIFIIESEAHSHLCGNLCQIRECSLGVKTYLLVMKFY